MTDEGFHKCSEMFLNIDISLVFFFRCKIQKQTEKKVYSTSLLWSTFLKEMYKWNQHSDILAFTLEKQKHRACGAGVWNDNVHIYSRRSIRTTWVRVTVAKNTTELI